MRLNYSGGQAEEYHGLRHIFHTRFWNLTQEHKEQALSLERDADVLGVHSYYAFHVDVPSQLSMEETRVAIGELLKIAQKRDLLGVSEEDILKLQAVITIMAGPTATIHLIQDNGRAKLLISSQTNILQLAIQDFIRSVVPEAKVFFVSGSQFEPYPEFYKNLAGRELLQLIYPDLSNSDSKMTIYPDTWVVEPYQFKRSFSRVCDRIREISELEGHQKIYLLTINSGYCHDLKNTLKEELPNIAFDYYRSRNSIGVANIARICIAIGAAEVPTNSFDHIAKDYSDSQRIRMLNVHADTWQAWSRVKDPAGTDPSKVYCIGIRKQKVSDVITWGLDRQVEVTEDSRGHLKGKVSCSNQLGRPKIAMEVKGAQSGLWPCNRTVADYIDTVVPIRDVIEIRKTYDSTCNINISENLGFLYYQLDTKLKLYNRPQNAEQVQDTLWAMLVLFVTRTDKCGLQWHQPGTNGKFGYRIGAPGCKFLDLLRQHLDGKETIAMPPFDFEDNCYFCAADFDDHAGNTPQSDNVKQFTGFLREKKLPHIVVKSGTNDGYHVFVPLVPTKTFTAMKFMKQLFKDAGLSDKKDSIERYPKQKSVQTTRGGYGNQIKLPLGFNWKAGRKSILVDAQTLEPADCVEITQAVALCDVQEPVAGYRNKVRSCAQLTSTESAPESSTMRLCIRGIVDEGVQLIGSDGHFMRVAIAAEALRCGLSEAETVDLFRAQSDFAEETTTSNIRYIWANKYHQFRCETLQETCNSMVSKYCRSCNIYGDYEDSTISRDI